MKTPFLVCSVFSISLFLLGCWNEKTGNEDRFETPQPQRQLIEIDENVYNVPNYRLEFLEIGISGEQLLSVNESVWVLSFGLLYEVTQDSNIWSMKQFALSPSIGDGEMIFDGVYIWAIAIEASAPSKLVQFDLTCHCVVKVYPLEGEPLSLAYGNGMVWVGVSIPNKSGPINKIVRYNIKTGDIDLEIELGDSYATRLEWIDDRIWSLDWHNSMVGIFDQQTGVLVQQYPTSPNPTGIASSNEGIWIVGATDGYITIIPNHLPDSPTILNIQCQTFQCNLNGLAMNETNVFAFSREYERVYQIRLEDFSLEQIYEVRKPTDIAVIDEQIWVLNGDRSRTDRGRTITIIDP